MFWWLAVGGQDGCATSATSPKLPNYGYVLPPPVIIVASPDNCAANADPPKSALTAVRRIGDDPNMFLVEVPVADEDKPVQKNSTFCWAACTQTLLLQVGQTIDQQAVADEYEPHKTDQSASVGVVIRALNPDLEPKIEAKGAVPIDVFPTTSDQMLGELMAGHLCMAGLVESTPGIGHACVVYGAMFAKLKPSIARVDASAAGMGPHAEEAMRTAAEPTYGICKIEYIDPDGGIRRTLTAQQFRNQVRFIIDRPYARDMLLAALSSDARYSSHSLVVQDAHSYMKSTSWSGPGHSESHVECSMHG